MELFLGKFETRIEVGVGKTNSSFFGKSRYREKLIEGGAVGEGLVRDGRRISTVMGRGAADEASHR